MYVLIDIDSVAICATPTLERRDDGSLLVYEGNLAIVDGIVVEIFENVTSLPSNYKDFKYKFDGENWELNPDFVEPYEESQVSVRLNELEQALAQTDETAIELFEMQLAQDEINAAQDDALIELYELIGG